VLYGMPMMLVPIAISHVYVWWSHFRATKKFCARGPNCGATPAPLWRIFAME
jgi:hypothetical protein